jgi:excisionase family DNA binding protein
MFVRAQAKGHSMAPDLTSNSVTSSPPPADLPTTGGALSIDQCCEYIGVRKTKLYAEVKSGRLELRKVGSKSVVFRSEAERWLRALPTAAETA